MNTTKIVFAAALLIMTACTAGQTPGVTGPETAEPRRTDINYCAVSAGIRQCFRTGSETEELRQAQETCDCDGDRALDSEDVREHPLCVEYYNGAPADPDKCHFSPVVGGGASSSSSSSSTGGGGNNSSSASSSSSTGGTSSSLDRCDPRNGIIPPDCFGGSTSSSSGTGSSSSSTTGGTSTSLHPCDPRNGSIPAYCDNWGSSSSSSSSSTGGTSTGGTSSSASSSSSSSSGGQSSSNPPVLWQFRDICLSAPGGYGDWDVIRSGGRDAFGNAMVEFNLCQLLWAFDTQDQNLRCDPGQPIRWVGTDVNEEAGRTGNERLNFNYAFGRNVGPVVEQSAGHVWARYTPNPVTASRVVEGVLRCSSPGGYGDLKAAVEHGRSLNFINVVSQEPFNARMIFTQTPQASGGGNSSSAGSSSTGGNNGTSSSANGSSSSSSSTGGPVGGPVGDMLGRADPQVPGAVLFNVRNFSPVQQQYFLLGTTRAVCLSCVYGNGIPVELVFKPDNSVEEIRVRPEHDGVYEWRLIQQDGSSANFNTPCENGVGGSSCRKYTNISTWYSAWTISVVNGVRQAVPRGGIDGQPGTAGGGVILKAYGSGSNPECRPDRMTPQVLNACTSAIPVYGTGVNTSDIRQWVGLYDTDEELAGFKVVYNDTCTPETMYCQQTPLLPANPGTLELFATPRKPFRIVAVLLDGREFTLNLSAASVPGNPTNSTFSCPYGQHFADSACRPNTRLSIVTVNDAALLQVD